MTLSNLSPMQVMAEIRWEQRATVMRSMIYTSGAGFGTNDAARVLRTKRAAAAHLLDGMVTDGLLEKSISNKKKITYNAKGLAWLSRPWRTVTNESLGIKSTRLGTF